MADTAVSQVNGSTNLTPLQMHRKVALLRRGTTGADIARRLGKSKAAVSAVIRDRIRSRAIEDAIAEAAGEPVEQLFPHRAA